MVLDAIVEFIYNQLDQIHCARLRKFYQHKNISTLIDVGSHKGEFINLTSTLKFKSIYSFEPQQKAMKLLKENTKNINSEIHYYNFAIGAAPSTTTFYENKLTSTSSFFKPKTDSAWIRFKEFLLGGGSSISDCYEVSVKTLDLVFFDENNNSRLNQSDNTLLKIDVEGYEYKVLMGGEKLLASGAIKFFQLERARYQIYDKSNEDIEGLLKTFGYERIASFTYPTLSFNDEIYARIEK